MHFTDEKAEGENKQPSKEEPLIAYEGVAFTPKSCFQKIEIRFAGVFLILHQLTRTYDHKRLSEKRREKKKDIVVEGLVHL